MNFFWRRLFFYLIGFFLGWLIVYGMLIHNRDREPWWPEKKILYFVAHSSFSVSEEIVGKLAEKNVSPEVLQKVIAQGNVIFSQSRPRKTPCPEYYVQAVLFDSLHFSCVVRVCYNERESRLLKINF